MGASVWLQNVKQQVEDELRFRIVGGDTAFVALVDRAGKKRFDLAVKCVLLWQRAGTPGRDKYYRLMEILRLITPDKAPGTKYRNAAVEDAIGYGRELDAQLADILRRDD